MTTGIRPLMATAAVAMAGVMPAVAGAQVLSPQTETGSRIPSKPRTVTGAERAMLLDQFARCIFRKRPDRVDYVLRHSDSVTVAPEFDDLKRYLPLESCIGESGSPWAGEVGGTFSIGALRGMLAEQAYKNDNVALPPPPIAGTLPAQRSYYSSGADIGQARGQANFADCLAEQDPKGSDALLRTRRGSAEERAAAHAMAPVLGACVPAGQTISLKAEDVRIFAADGLWQRYVAAKPAKYEGRP